MARLGVWPACEDAYPPLWPPHSHESPAKWEEIRLTAFSPFGVKCLSVRQAQTLTTSSLVGDFAALNWLVIVSATS